MVESFPKERNLEAERERNAFGMRFFFFPLSDIKHVMEGGFYGTLACILKGRVGVTKKAKLTTLATSILK